jgi:hypothetical protein
MCAPLQTGQVIADQTPRKDLSLYLSSYSPELSPDELLDADLEQCATKAVPTETKSSLTRAVIAALCSVQNCQFAWHHTSS